MIHRPAKSVRLENSLRKSQDNRCYYCNQDLGSVVKYKKTTILLCGVLDHVVPFVYCQYSKGTNLVLSCQVCNAMKNDKMFDTMADLLEYLQFKWARLRGDYQKWTKSKKSKSKKDNGINVNTQNAKITTLQNDPGKISVLKNAETTTMRKQETQEQLLVLIVAEFLTEEIEILKRHGVSQNEINDYILYQAKTQEFLFF